MKVTVTQDHIDNGDSCNSCGCAFALALREVGRNVSVGSDECSVSTNADVWKGMRLRFKLPSEARKFIDRFDSGARCEPEAFELTEVVLRDSFIPAGLELPKQFRSHLAGPDPLEVKVDAPGERPTPFAPSS